MNVSPILAQVRVVTSMLKLSFDASNPWFGNTLKLYEKALDNPTEINLIKLLDLSRAYLETSSDWGQDFFIEIEKTEQLLKAYLDKN